MKNYNKSTYLWKKLLMFIGIVALLTGYPQIQVFAASGTVYTSSITRCYRHPVTGNIEDSGGESGYVTGQGMVEGCVSSSGILEVTDSGQYYLTFRMSLMDYTTDHSFLVQNVGDSGWTEMALGQTGSGTDSSGTTADVCVQVPSENCIVRISMYVTAMGRNVVFYIYPSNYQQGNQTNFKATMVTESASASTSSSGSTASGSTTTSSAGSASSGTTSASSGSASSNTSTSSSDSATTTSAGSTSSGTATSSGSASSDTSTSSSGSTTTVSESTTTDNTATTVSESASSDTTTISSGTADLTSIMDSVDGLSLSTDSENTEDNETTETTKTTKTGLSAGKIIGIAAAVTVSGVILMWNMAGIVYLFRKNWYRWGGGIDDEED